MSVGPQIQILAFGRLLSAIGSGFTAFYASIFFVNIVHLLPAAVGIGIGSGSFAGMVGRILSGSLSDSKLLSRKGTMLLAVGVQAVGSFILAMTMNFETFLVGNVLMGLGVGLYWPATQAFVADATKGANLDEAYALTFLADYVGMALGVLLGGVLIGAGGEYRSLFVVDGASFLLFFAVVVLAIKESRVQPATQGSAFRGWGHAFSNSHLRVYVLFNILFTAYIAIVDTVLPLFLKNFVHYGQGAGFPNIFICGFFTEYIAIMSIIQVKTTKATSRFRKTRVLTAATVAVLAAFVSVWLAGSFTNADHIFAATAISMALFAIATVLYAPAASALVVEFAPENSRGVYLAINSLCWAAGAAIGPPIGLAALGQSPGLAHQLWLALAASTIVPIFILLFLGSKLPHPVSQPH